MPHSHCGSEGTSQHSVCTQNSQGRTKKGGLAGWAQTWFSRAVGDQSAPLGGGACDRHCLSLCQCNGMSNRFWGWGREDDEFYRRIKGAGLQVRLLAWLCLVLAYMAGQRFPLLQHQNSWCPPGSDPCLYPDSWASSSQACALC